MAEIYPPGNVRLFYRSSGFKSGVHVVADVLSSDLSVDSGFVLTEISNGMYYFDYLFPVGYFAVMFYEGGIPMTTQNFLIKKDSSGIFIGSSNRGDLIGW